MSNPAYTPERLRYKTPYEDGVHIGTRNGYTIGFQECKRKVLEIILKNTNHNFTLGDILKMSEEINKL